MKLFTSVKVEFTDLDGLRWSQTALRRFPVRYLVHTSRRHLEPIKNIVFSQKYSSYFSNFSCHIQNNTFVVLTNTDLANFSAEDTIRVSTSATKLRPRYTGQQPPATPHISTLLPQCIVDIVIAIDLDLLLKVYSNLNQSSGFRLVYAPHRRAVLRIFRQLGWERDSSF